MNKKKQDLPLEEPTNLADWLWRVRQYENTIYVRELVKGHWESVALGSLSPERWAGQVARMLEAGMNPVRLRGKEEK